MRLPKFLLRHKNLFSWKQLMFFWYRNYKQMFFMGFLGVLSLGGYFWYQHLYRYQWSAERKKDYLDQNFTQTNFKEKVFLDTVAHLKARAQNHRETLSVSRDIFFDQSQP